jgi:sigma-B regulation protein RsbU (phosphoserine phosphatase)
MQLKRRIMFILLLAMALLVMALGMMGWLGEQRWEQRYNEALLQSQRIAWDKLQNESLDRQDALARKLLEDSSFRNLQAPGAQQRIDTLLANAVREAPGLRIDILGPSGALLSTTEPGFDPQPLAEYGWVKAAMAATAGVRGLSQVAPRQYDWVAVHGFEGGALAIGQDVALRLPELSAYLGGDVFLVNMRGKETLGTRTGNLAATGAVVPVRSPQALIIPRPSAGSQKEGALQLISQPVTNPDRRVVGALVWMQDVTQQYHSDRFFNWAAAGGALLFAALIVLGLAAYMQHAMEPLSRSVGVLKALASGATDASLDDGEEEAEDESGAIARGVVAIRSELLNLETLRQERIRTRQQQERLIRDQLRSLAESLDPASREEILAALGTRAEAPTATPAAAAADAPQPGNTNHLAELAGILGRMSGLVSTQQSRLLKLLRELQAAVQTQAMLASLQQELEIARQMQLSILPRSAPDLSEIDIAATMIPAKEVGGDFYDYFPIDDEHLAIVVADVSGKGVPAAFFMAISRTLLKSNALFLRFPGPTIEALNDQLCAENDQMMFVTVFYGVLHLRSGKLTYVNAGHNPPVRLLDGKARFFERGRNMALAVMEEQEYTEGEVTLTPGETLLLYTDGVTEANNAEGVLFGDQALLDAMVAVGNDPVYKGHARGVPQRVVQAVRAFEAGAAQADDITVVAITYQGPRS